MGDSAKVVSPFGARGGNTGVGDADNLAWKLAAVQQGRAAPRLLDSYHEERHEAARENVLVTNRTARFLRPADGVERVFRSAVIALAKRHEFARQFVNTGRMAVANSYHFSSACTKQGVQQGGISLQNIAFQWASASRRSAPRATGVVNDLLRWADGRLLVLVFGPLSLAAAARLRRLSQAAPVCCVQVVTPGQPAQAVEHVVDCNAAGRHALRTGCLGQARAGWALVRPDAYLAATGVTLNGSLVQAIQKSLGM
jgi:3-(3-hydroxy-phenyl)propionate hydroxylase